MVRYVTSEVTNVISQLAKFAGVGGVALGVVLLVFRSIVRKRGLFSRLTKEQSYRLLTKVIHGTFVIAIVAIVAWALVHVLPRSAAAETSLNQLAIEYKQGVLGLRGDFEALDRNPSQREQVVTRAASLAGKLANLQDDRLDLFRRNLKYQYGGWAFLIGARATTDKDEARRLVGEAVRALERARDIVAEAKNGHGRGEPEAVAAYDYMVGESDDANRILLLLAAAYSLDADLLGAHTKQDVQAVIAQVPLTYRKRYPPCKVQGLEWLPCD